MKEEKSPRSRAEKKSKPPAPRSDGQGKAGPPAEFIYDNAQILLQLLRARSEEEDRRRFVAGLLRGPDEALTPDEQ